MEMKPRLHFMGVKGSGMAGIYSLASKMGYDVTGCDLEADGHDVCHLKGIDILVVTPAVFYKNSKHPELMEAQKRGIVLTWQEFLSKYLLKGKKVIAIAGTHGKSTTTAMIGKLLIDAGLDPIVVLGAKVPAWGGSSRFGKGEYAVIEADEFNNNFLNYTPEITIVTNIEFDHPDFFKSEVEVKESFKKFKAQSKFIIDSAQVRKFNLKVLGEHNQRNASFVYELGKRLGISEEKIIKSIESFEGIGRRMELISNKNGVKIYDDYAHHPTAIKTTLEGLRSKYPDAKILAIIEPHGYKRTKALLPLYKNIFDSVDEVIIGPIFQARDKIDKSITPEKVAQISRHRNIQVIKNIKNLKSVTGKAVKIRNYDVVVVMGAGKSNLWAQKLSVN
ncbi:MAG: cyanophycin synthetase [Patescibacteria group bacterium]